MTAHALARAAIEEVIRAHRSLGILQQQAVGADRLIIVMLYDDFLSQEPG
jgi:hypothetical protein